MTNFRQSIFITGAASGIGLETARLFASMGWYVGLYDFDAERLDAVRTQFDPESSVHGVLDVRNLDSWRQAVDHFSLATGGRMDVLLNNAGIAHIGLLDQMAVELQRDMIETNLIGVTNGISAALPLLKASAPSRIINIASAAGLHGPPRIAIYGATKAAVINLSQALDLELATDRVQVSCVLPWYVDTPILDAIPIGSNETARETLSAVKESVYPVETAAQAIWTAAHSDTRQITVGREAGLFERLRRWFPGLTRRLYQKRYQDQLSRLPDS